ncbi:aminopeptidase P family protein [Terrimonas pollutisoli]|uniref:aminopeptidase P family protein n=1 Tax=Terrimonas pollutisoli TaxID=3034147 RepID=UPI0023EAFB57|nr:aminopeptidase P family protein [Terrimonas sp. H1YJ31]
MFSKETYIQRRQRLKKDVGSGVILLLGNEDTGMNYKDNCYPFRQDSSFLYFIGLDKPSLAAVINIDEDNEIVFGDDPTIDDIVWMGTQPTVKELAAPTGITTVMPAKELKTIIQKAITGGQNIHFLPPYRSENFIKINELINIPLDAIKEKASVALIKAVVAQRAIKSTEEVAEINKAVNTSNEMHLAAIRHTKEGLTEMQVAGIVQGIAIAAGGNISYPIIYTVDGQTLHNHPTSRVLKKGELVLCDAGAETAMHYAGDLTRTFPVDKKFTPVQKEVYDIVLKAEEAAAKALAPGKFFKDIHFLAAEHLVDGLKQMGLMKGDAKEAVQQSAHALFFPCGLGHMMGLDVHDMEDLGEQYVGYTDDLKKSTLFGLKSLRLGRALEPGFVLTVEPGIYFIPELIDLWEGQKKFTDFINYEKLAPFRNFGGARVEENFLITEKGTQLLGEPLIKTTEEIETLLAE